MSHNLQTPDAPTSGNNPPVQSFHRPAREFSFEKKHLENQQVFARRPIPNTTEAFDYTVALEIHLERCATCSASHTGFCVEGTILAAFAIEQLQREVRRLRLGGAQ